MLALGWTELCSSGGETIFYKEGTVLGFYVDDGAAVGKRKLVVTQIGELGGYIEMSTAVPLQHFL